MALICISLMISDIEHMSIGHLYVLFGEVLIQIISPFINQIVCGKFFGVELYKFFINFGY